MRDDRGWIRTNKTDPVGRVSCTSLGVGRACRASLGEKNRKSKIRLALEAGISSWNVSVDSIASVGASNASVAGQSSRCSLCIAVTPWAASPAHINLLRACENVCMKKNA